MNSQFFPPDTVFSVTNLTLLIKDLLEQGFHNITLEGEISNFRPNASGHLYFTLKDENSQISAVMFRGKAWGLTFKPKEGDKVKVTGDISVYPPQGKYQINITKMEPAGQGNILQMLEERKQRLAAEGLFDQSRKKKIPFMPQTVGVVTSSTGAAIRDILQITKRRNPNVNVIILPSLVQGAGAGADIARQIKTASDFNLCDVLIVGRGGGSLEDLLCFSDEVVCRAIAECKIPVISAVGHEIDWALSDYAADLRAPTPSAAAEIAVPMKNDLLNAIHGFRNDMYQSISDRIAKLRLMVKTFDVGNMEQRFRSIQNNLMTRLANAQQNLINNMVQKTKETRLLVERHRQILEEASPQKILSRGYSMIRIEGTDKIVTRQQDVTSGTRLTIYPAEGQISATVN